MKENILYALKEIISDGHIIKASVKGKSMSPFLSPGDTVFIKSAGYKDIKLGDILVFETPQGLCSHRFLKKFTRQGRGFFLAKSDRIFIPVEVFSESELLGKVMAVKKKSFTWDFSSFFWRLFNRIWAILHLMLRQGRYCSKL